MLYPKKPELASATLSTAVSWTRELMSAYIFCEGTGPTIRDFSVFGSHVALSDFSDNMWIDNPGGDPGERRWALNLPNGPRLHRCRIAQGTKPTLASGNQFYTLMLGLAIDCAGIASGASLGGTGQGYVFYQSLGWQLQVNTAPWYPIRAYDGVGTITICGSMASGVLRDLTLIEETGPTSARWFVDGVQSVYGYSKVPGEATLDIANGNQTLTQMSRVKLAYLYEWHRALSTAEADAVRADPFTPFGVSQLTSPPSSPTGPSFAISASTSELVIGWEPSVDPMLQMYNIYQSVTTPDSFVLVATAPTAATAYTATGLAASTGYYFEVRGYSEGGETPAIVQIHGATLIENSHSSPDNTLTLTPSVAPRIVPINEMMTFPVNPGPIRPDFWEWLAGAN